ncbi:MAG: molybdate transport system ATP-binding protein, partial [Thermodesulfobacteriota bacterium]|nr:molybdate transport system ATP-binding protein [Thermodesulfobacteriota bacterium]
LASLDVQRKGELLPFIARLPQELSIPILYVSHSIDEIINLAETAIVLDDGHVTAEGAPLELVAWFDRK